MSKGRELTKNTIILFVGTFLTKIISYFLLPIYTGYLSTSEYGTVDLISTIVTLMIPIVYLQIDQGVFRFLISNRKDEKEIKKIISTSVIFELFLNTIILLIFSFINVFITNQYTELIIANFFVVSFYSLCSQITRGLGNNKHYSIASFISAVITIAGNIIFLTILHFKVEGMILGTIIGHVASTLYIIVFMKLYRYISLKSFDKSVFKKLIKYSFPMIPNTLSWWVFSSSDRVVATIALGLSTTGLLSIVYKFSNIEIIIYNVFNMSITESIALHINDKDIESYYNKVFHTIGNIFITAGAMLIAFMPIIFKISVNAKFNDAYNLIPLAIIATELQVFVGLLGVIYIAKNNTKSIAITSVVTAIVNIFVDISLINHIGLYAAVISTIVSYMVLIIYRYFDVNQHYMKVKINKRMIVNLFISNIVICILYYFNNKYTIVLNMIIATLCFVVFNIDNIKFLLNLLKRRENRNEKFN